MRWTQSEATTMEFSLSPRATGGNGGWKESCKNEKDKKTDRIWDYN